MSLPPQLLHTLENLKYQAKDAFWALSSCICQQSAKIKINGRTFKIVKVLGEGGFSFVYLAQDEHSGRQFALKKIRCPSGQEDVRQAMREVEAYRRFKHPNIIRILDSAVVQDPAGDGQIVYLFLPLYKKGNLQDAINANSINGTHFSEKEMLRLFKGTCEAEDEMFPQPEGDAEGGYSYHGPSSRSASAPLISKQSTLDDDELSHIQQNGRQNGAASGDTELVPYAHRDLKPGNVMIDDNGRPILMDFGSCMKARVKIENRSQALLQQDIAAEQNGNTIDEKVDIGCSLGCTLFALAYSHSPFENTQTTEQGGSIAMAVMNGQYKHPASQYSQGLKELIDALLVVDPQHRPDIHQVNPFMSVILMAKYLETTFSVNSVTHTLLDLSIALLLTTEMARSSNNHIAS
ncbi:kinase-like domain-containing protein [Irpex lacteus]|nr:kinase-like domain-containing protein [Irpex lacteus]